MQFQVPQFIETESRVVGPLTLKQFIYVAAAAGMSFILYSTVKMWLWFILSMPIVGFGLVLAFLKIQGRPFISFLMSAFNFYWRPQKYVWQTENPNLPKNESTMKEIIGPAIWLENLLSGFALKKVWQDVQTGRKTKGQAPMTRESQEKYEIVKRLTGERKAMKRVDYR